MAPGIPRQPAAPSRRAPPARPRGAARALPGGAGCFIAAEPARVPGSDQGLRFVLDELLGVASLAALPRYREFSSRPGRLGDRRGGALRAGRAGADQSHRRQRRARFHDGAVQMPAAVRDAYQQYIEGGWTQLRRRRSSAARAHRWCWRSRSRSSALAPTSLSCCVRCCARRRRGARGGGIRALQALLLPKIVSGEWTGTMNLTEPQAGSDLALIRARATPDGDHYRISGQKIFITYGEHDLARTSCTWCWRASMAPRPGSRASRCSRCPSSCSMPTAASARTTICAASRSNTSSASMRARPA
jgi:hypothetical protein